MSYIGNLIKIEVSKASDCSYIIVEDVTSYPQPLGGVSKSRDDIGLALFYSKDNWSTSDGDLSNPTKDSPWIFPTTNNNTYDIGVFVVPVWEDGSYADNYIVYSSRFNKFYINDSGDSTTQTPGYNYSPINGGNEWTELTIDDYSTFETYLGSAAGDYGYTLGSEVTDCNRFYSQRTGCHEYTIVDNSGGLTVNSITLIDYDEVTIQSGLSFSGGTLDITIEEDGVYILNINYNDNNGDEQLMQLPIFDMCDTEICIKAMIRYVLCKCDDPCDENCNEENDIERKRDEINRIIAMYFPIMGYIYTDTAKYLGAMDFSDARSDFMQQVGRMVEQIKVMTERCGLCEDTDNNDCCD